MDQRFRAAGHRRITLGVCLLFLPLSSSRAQTKNDPKPAKAKALSLVGKPAPEFSLPGAKQTFNLVDQRGKVVVLAFWATWCPPCRSEMPTFAKLQNELVSQGVAVVPVANDDSKKANDFLVQKKLDLWSLIDDSHTVSRLYGANFLPKTIVIDREGVVAKVLIGKASEADVRHAIQTARR